MKHKKWFWGIFLLAAAVFILANQIGAFAKIGPWSIIAAVLLAAVCVDSLAELNFFGIFIPLALLYLIFQPPFHWIVIPFWPLILAAVLASIGLSILAPRRGHWGKKVWHWEGHGHGKTEGDLNGNNVYLKSSFNDSCKYLHSDCLKKAHFVSSFGNLIVYMDKVTLDPKGAEVFVDVRFGNMTLYLSKDWRVTNMVNENAGSKIEDNGSHAADDGGPIVTLKGDVSFGRLEICYV